MRKPPILLVALALAISACGGGSGSPLQSIGKKPAQELRQATETDLADMALSLDDFGSAYSDFNVDSAKSGPQSRADRVDNACDSAKTEQEIDNYSWLAGYDRIYSIDTSGVTDLSDLSNEVFLIGSGLDLYDGEDNTAAAFKASVQDSRQEEGTQCQGLDVGNVSEFKVPSIGDEAWGANIRFSGSSWGTKASGWMTIVMFRRGNIIANVASASLGDIAPIQDIVSGATKLDDRIVSALTVSAQAEESTPADTARASRPTVRPTPTAEQARGTGERAGVTDTTIKIGTLLPLSNTSVAALGVPMSAGMKAYFDYINDHGGIYGRKIELIVGDNQYTGPTAAEAARKLVEQDDILVLQGSFGGEADTAVHKYLEENGVPDMWILSGDEQWTQPISKNRFGYSVGYADEGHALGLYVAGNFPGGKLGILAENDNFGKEGEGGIRRGIDDAGGNVETTTQYYDAAQVDVTAQMQRLRNDGATVVAFFAGIPQAASGIKAARETLGWDVSVVVSGMNAAEIVGQLAGYENIEGAVSVVSGHQAFETSWPGVKELTDILAKYAPDTPMNNLTLLGMSVSEATVSALRQAGEDLTRSGFLKASESFCGETARASLAPVNMSPTDHRPLEALQYVRAHAESGVLNWVPFGDVISFESTISCTPPARPSGYDQLPR